MDPDMLGHRAAMSRKRELKYRQGSSCGERAFADLWSVLPLAVRPAGAFPTCPRRRCLHRRPPAAIDLHKVRPLLRRATPRSAGSRIVGDGLPQEVNRQIAAAGFCAFFVALARLINGRAQGSRDIPQPVAARRVERISDVPPCRRREDSVDLV